MKDMDSKYEKRLAENQVIFESRNKKMDEWFNNFKRVAANEEGIETVLDNEDVPLYMYCECSDENCTARIAITSKAFKKVHTASDQFIIAPKHEVGQIEDVVYTDDDLYWVVKKHKKPSHTTDYNLNETDLDNTKV